MSLWNWLQENATALSAVGNLLAVLIWSFYLQLFYRQYCRQQRAKLVIHHAQGLDPSASCLLVNMSEEAVHVQCVMVQVETEDAVRTHQVTDYNRISADDPNAEQLLRQGPLKSGDFLLLGRFEDLIRGDAPCQGQPAPEEQSPFCAVQTLELRAIAIHGPSDHPVGARRRFTVQQQEGQIKISPEQLHTDQLASRRDRPHVREWLRDCFDPAIEKLAASARD